MLSNFRIVPFLVGIGSAVLIFSFYKPEKEVIRQYPHPSESENKVYRDHNRICYKYSSHEVDCDANEATITEFPVQA